MLVSSPFRESHRRARSHSSISTPSSPPVSFPDGIRSPAFTRSPAGYGFGFSDDDLAVPSGSSCQPPDGRRDIDARRHNKRPRREQSFLEDAEMDSDTSDQLPKTHSVVSNTTTMSMQWAGASTSAPSTPRLPSTSDAFHFFPSRASYLPLAFPAHTAKVDSPAVLSDAEHFDKQQGLAQAQDHSDAYSDLRRTVHEAGESFVQRMREFEEEHRVRRLRVNTKNASAGALGPAADSPARRNRFRGRKRRSPISSHDYVHFARTEDGEGECGKRSDIAEDDDSDVEIRSNYASGSDDDELWSPSKKRAVSLCGIEGEVHDARPHPYSLPFAIPLRKGERSSSPSACTNSSDDEDEDDCNGRPHPFKMQHSRVPKRTSASATTPPLSFSFSSASNNSSMISLPPTDSFAAPGVFGPLPPNFPSHITPSSKGTEKVLEALSLAIANGAGSVSDYEASQNAQRVLSLDDSEAGSLWD